MKSPTINERDKKKVQEDLDLGHEDNEPHMLKADLYRIGKYAMELYQMMDGLEGQGEVDLPHWWQSKIINAKSNIVGAKHYLDFEINEPKIDGMVDTIDSEPSLESFDENLDLEAKIDALQRLKRGEIDTLPSRGDVKSALVKKVMGKLTPSKVKEGLVNSSTVVKKLK